MRILANYGHKTNGDSYNVTFEQTGDVPLERANETIDMLFRRAREAVQRQIDGNLELPSAEITIPKLKNNNGNGKPQLRNPEAPASQKQRGLLGKIAKERGIFIEGLNSLTMAEASRRIEEFLAV